MAASGVLAFGSFSKPVEARPPFNLAATGRRLVSPFDLRLTPPPPVELAPRDEFARVAPLPSNDREAPRTSFHAGGHAWGHASATQRNRPQLELNL